MENIATNLAHVRDVIATAAAAANRNAKEIKLIAVSKTKPLAAVEAAVTAGQTVFGESTVQEAFTKIPHFRPRGIEWHFIGHLQSNKVRFIPGNFSWVHSIDSARLAQRLSRLAQAQGVVINALVEINITRDPDKHGIAPEQLFPVLGELRKEALPGIALRGLMTIGPHPADTTERRAAFARVRQLRDETVRRFALPHFTELSMGMSGDYAEAIREGSTMIRVGSEIFGERNYGDR